MKPRIIMIILSLILGVANLISADTKKDSVSTANRIKIYSTPYKKKVRIEGKEFEARGTIRKLIFPNQKIIELGCTEKTVEKKHPQLPNTRRIRELTTIDASISKDGKYVLVSISYSDIVIPESKAEENSEALPGDSSNIQLFDSIGKKLWEFKLPYKYTSGNYEISDSNTIVAILGVIEFGHSQEDVPRAKLWILNIQGKLLWSYPYKQSEAVDFHSAGGLKLSSNGRYILVNSGEYMYFIDLKNRRTYKNISCGTDTELFDNGIVVLYNCLGETKNKIFDTLDLNQKFEE